MKVQVEIDTYTMLFGAGLLVVAVLVVAIAMVDLDSRERRTEVWRTCLTNHGVNECRELVSGLEHVP